MTQKKIVYGLFDDDDDLLHAIEKIRAKSIAIREVYTPFPVHGLDRALGLRPTRLPYAAFGYGVFGLLLAITITWYMMIYDWPQDIGGKPSFSWLENMPSFVPIMFELTVFCTAHFMCITYFVANRLYPGAAAQNPDPRTTDDKFLIEIETKEKDPSEIEQLLKENGAVEITTKALEV